ncbi:ROK family protein [Enterococcus sp. BWR-S5]|uniref:ROK family protein n=1 Tax=Enterococcus sp. BWR-S5 TaxID=2787714 RepID=UPI001924B45F|nr:ROK family protein [Enterococcus sp. BWR-S5]MBL1226929.1 ROK family protein [Enterococcus sp. BWR-S5]
MAILAFDLGGSAVKYGVWEKNELHGTGKFPTPKTWEEMKKALLETKMNVPFSIEGIAFSAPGVVDERKRQILGISAIPYIHHFDIYDELENLFQLPVTIENDANCAGMAEIYEGAAKGKQEVAFVVIGTGIGGAVFHKGEIVKGAHLYGGEFGLMFLNDGKTFSSLGTAVHMAWRYCDRKGVERETFSGEDVFMLANQGDVLATEEVENFYEYLTQGLFSIQFSLDPQVIVLGGGVSAKEGLLEEINQRMEKKLKQFDLKDFVPEIVICEYRNDANLVGAAANFIAHKQ